MIEFLIITWIGLAWGLFIYWGLRCWYQVRHRRAAFQGNPPQRDWGAWLTFEAWWNEPGWWVRHTTFAWVSRVLSLPVSSLTLLEFLRLKQTWWQALWLCFLAWWWLENPSGQQLLGLGGLLVLLSLLPDAGLYYWYRRWHRQIAQEMPYFLEVLTLSLESGLNLTQALHMTTEHLSGALTELLRRELRALQWGKSLEAILTELKAQLQQPDFSQLLESVLRAQQLGVSVGQTLRVQTQLLRTRRRQKAEALSRTAAVKMSVPLVLCIFPALLLIYVGPGVLQLLAQA